jgi:flagellar secretion chaperone FliS
MTSDPTLSYQRASASGATPIGQIVALYDTILRDFARALAALQAGDVESRVFELNHALLVIAHLQNVLDFERGGDAAKQLNLLYSVTRGQIVQANIQATPESIEEIINLFGGLRQAWYDAEQKLLLENAPQSAPASDPRNDAPVAHEDTDANDGFAISQIQWSA